MTELERRKAVRAKAVFRVRFAGDESFTDAHALDVAADGLAVQTEREVAVGEIVSLAVSLPGIVEGLELKGVVRWCDADADHQNLPDGSLGMQLEFSNAQQRQDWLRLVQILTGEGQRYGLPTADAPYRALVVENNGFVSKMFDAILDELEAAGADTRYLRIVFETDPEVILETARSEDLDLVIVTPGEDLESTYNLIRSLRGELASADVPILATGFPNASSGVRTVEAGATMYLADEGVMWRTLSSMCVVVVSGIAAGA